MARVRVRKAVSTDEKRNLNSINVKNNNYTKEKMVKPKEKASKDEKYHESSNTKSKELSSDTKNANNPRRDLDEESVEAKNLESPTKGAVTKEHSSTDSDNRPSSNIIFLYMIGLIIFLIGSVFLINHFFSQEEIIDVDETYIYNTYKFDKIGNYWYTDLIFSSNQNKMVNLEMRYDPRSLQDIKVSHDLYDNFVKTQAFIITANPTLSGITAISMMHLNRIIGQEFGLFNYPTFAAITEPHDSMNEDTPIFSCENATPQNKVIWLGLTNETKVDYNNNCISISGSNETEILRSTDRFLYEIMGIMNASK
jgi:hypothetical protein